MSSSRPGLHVADYVVFAAMLLVSFAIGVYYSVSGGKQRTTDEYLMGNRQMSVLPVTLSYTVSFTSTILLLGYPAEIYAFGSEITINSIGIFFGVLLVVFTFLPVLYPLKYTSVNEYLLHRYDSQLVKGIGSLCSLSFAIIYSSTVYFGPATAIEAVAGIPAWISILMASLVSVCYTTIGGFKAVVWTDVFQSVIMVVGILALVVKGTIDVGGLDRVFQANADWGRLKFFEWDWDLTRRVSTWSAVLNRMIWFLMVAGCGQPSFQRYSSMATQAQANKVVLGAIPGQFILSLLAYFLGWIVFAHYAILGCDPLKSGKITNPNQVVPWYVMEVFNVPGAPGLFLAACTAASLSSASSSLNAASAIAWEDILKPLVFPNASKFKAAQIAKLLVLVFGCIATAISVCFSTVGGTVVQILATFLAAFDGVYLIMFLCGIFIPFVNWKGLACASVFGLTFGLWVSIGSYMIKKHLEVLPTNTANCAVVNSTWVNTTLGFTPTDGIATTSLTEAAFTASPPNQYGLAPWLYTLYSLSFLWLLPIVFAIVFIVAIVTSLLTGGRSDANKIKPCLLHPLTRKLCKISETSYEEVACKEDFMNMDEEGKTEAVITTDL